MTAPPLKDIKTLRERLGDGDRGEGFEDWVRMNLRLEDCVGTDDEKALVRMINTLCIAQIEVARSETEAGRSYAETITLLARATGIAVAGVVMSVVKPGEEIAMAHDLFEDIKAGLMLVAEGAAGPSPERSEDK